MSDVRISDATGRIDLRRRDLRRRRLILGVVAGVVLALFGTAAWLVWASDVLAVRTVEVSGAKAVPAEQVRTLADVAVGTPLVRVDLAEVANRVAGLPPVAGVSVAREWPGTLRITITERTAAYAIETAGGYWIADGDGVIFASAARAPKGLVVAQVAGDDPRLVRDLSTVLRALPAGVRDKLKRVDVTSADAITLELSGNTTIVWGSADQSELKAQVITSLMKTKQRVYDVSAPSFPVTR